MNESSIERLRSALEDRYAIERDVGEGGMATVYLAKDLKHNRNVALKVLKPELAAVVGAERFLAEIETTANLQHPHILPLYDSGEADGFLFYVMPYVEGETLRDRLDREKQLPVDEAVRIATAVANALEYAHQHGVVHRDIKPGNIMLQAGQPVVGDFGIALAVGSAGGARLTETGLSVGTPYYMSPEQATGDMHVGPATDIYALGAVLYELLTGDPPYMGSTAQAVLGQIISGEPVSATTRRRSIPAHVDAALRKALEKLPADRFTSASGLAAALADPGFRYGGAAAARAAGDGPGLWRPAAIVASILAVVSAGLGLALAGPGPESPRRVERFAAPFLPGQELTYTRWAGFQLSPDGSTLAYRLNTDDGQHIFLRRWDELSATRVRETLGAAFPVFSPDGSELAFDQDGEIKALALAGGPVRTLGEGFAPMWGTDGFIYFLGESAAYRVPSAGGAVEQITGGGEGLTQQLDYPLQVVDGGSSLLLEVEDENGSRLHLLDLETREISEPIVPVSVASKATVLGSGHLLYLADGDLMVAPLDVSAGQLGGAPVPILSGVLAFSVSDDGKLFYTTGAAFDASTELVMEWVDRTGNATVVDPDWSFFRGPDVNFGFELSPDGRRVALREETSEGYDIWVKQLDTGPRSRITYDPAHDRKPVWSRDGRTLYFLSDRNGDIDLWRRSADGTGSPELVLDLEASLATISMSPNGEWIFLRSSTGNLDTSERNIFALRMDGQSEAQTVLATDYRELQPGLSPDGRWLVYASDETGRYEIYVRPFPEIDSGRWQVSIGGGFNPQWASSGREIFFQDLDRRMMTVPVDPDGSTFSAGTPEVLFDYQGGWLWANLTGVFYDVAPDDERFMVARLAGTAATDDDETPSGILVNNFDLEIDRIIGR